MTRRKPTMDEFRHDEALIYFDKAVEDLTPEEYAYVDDQAYQSAESWEDGE
jgi:hypothetical protein